MRDLSDAVASSCICLQNSNIPFNVLISDCGKRVFLFPQVLFLSLISFLLLFFLVITFADVVLLHNIACRVNFHTSI